MKKLCMIFAILSLFVFVSCGDSKKENKDETTDSSDTVNDEDSDAADTDSSDTGHNEKPDSDSGDSGDSQSDSGDSQSDSGDSQSDSGDSQPDGGDSQPDEDADTAPAVPECNGINFPCKDSVTGYIWSSKSKGDIKGQSAEEYCEDSTEGGFSWKLPKIDELRTLIKGCDGTKTNGDCAISEKNGKLSQDYWSSKCYCSEDSFDEGIYSIFGDTENWFWSSSLRTEDSSMWGVDFHQARITAEDPATKAYVRCVVNDEEDPGDTQPDADADSGDSQPDEDADVDTDSGETLQECSKDTTIFPCKDSSRGNLWSEKISDTTWGNAKTHCEGLNTSNYGGFNSGWHLPTISELRTLIKICTKNAMPGGSCEVRDDESAVCLENTCWTGTAAGNCVKCDKYTDGRYSKLGDTDYLWSSSLMLPAETNYAWTVEFDTGSVRNNHVDTLYYSARCVRKAE